MTSPKKRLKSIISHLLYPHTASNQSTTYSYDFTQRYQQLKKDLNFLYDGLQSTVIFQLLLYHKQNNIDTSQMNIIDIACGDGNYSRMLSNCFNYNKIVGVDISESQIALAKKKTNSKIYPNIEYKCIDASSIDLTQTFDIGIAVWFYNYANTKHELYKYIQSTYNTLKPNGIIIGITNSIKDIKQCKNGYFQKNPKLGQFIQFNLFEQNVSIQSGYEPNVVTFNVNLYDFATYKSLFKQAGFTKINFLKSEQYKVGNNSTQYEKDLFAQFYNDKYMKHNIRHVFIAQK